MIYLPIKSSLGELLLLSIIVLIVSYSPPPPSPGLYHSKRFKTLYKDGVLLCLPLSIDHLTEKTPDRVAREMARCLHEVFTLLSVEIRYLSEPVQSY